MINNLVVDDNATNRMVLTKMLERDQNNKVVAVDSGYDALVQVNKLNFDIIWMDIRMPGMNGIECTKILRKLKFREPIIAVTGHVDAECQKEYYAAGIDHVLPKPVSLEALSSVSTNYITHNEPNKKVAPLIKINNI